MVLWLTIFLSQVYLYAPNMNTLARKARQVLRESVDSFLSATFHDKRTLGSARGSQWTVRTAGLTDRSVVYSGGVGGDISFEIELVRRFGLSVVIFDPSPIAIQTMDKCAGHPEMRRIDFQPVGLAAECREVLFRASNVPGEWIIAGDPKERTGQGFRAARQGGTHKAFGRRVQPVTVVRDPKEQCFSFPCTTIAEEMKKRGHRQIDLLKLDIEGFEYEVLRHCMFNTIPVKQICVEFHHFLPHISAMQTLSAIAALYRRNFRLLHKFRHDMTFYTRLNEPPNGGGNSRDRGMIEHAIR